MSNPEASTRRRGRTIRKLAITIVVLAGIGGGGIWAVSRAPLPAPGWLLTRLETRIDAAIAPMGLEASIGSVSIDLRDLLVPTVQIGSVQLTDMAGEPALQMREMDAVFSRDDLLAGQLVPKAVRLTGLDLAGRIDENGNLAVRFGTSEAPPIGSPGEFVDSLRGILDQSGLDALKEIGVDDLSLSYQDDRSGIHLQSENGRLRISRTGPRIMLDASTKLTPIVGVKDDEIDARATLKLVSEAPGGAATVALAALGVVPARLEPVLGGSPLAGVVSRFDAPVNITLNADVGEDGEFSDMLGTLAVGEGQLRLPGSERSVAVHHARATVRASPDGGRLDMTELSLEADGVKLSGRLSVLADTRGEIDAFDQTTPLVAQVTLDQLWLNPPGIFELPVSLDSVQVEMRGVPTERSVELGRVQITQGDVRVDAHGSISAANGLSLDVSVDQILPEQLVALWPVDALDKTRLWLQRNVVDGTLKQVRGSLRAAPGEKPELAASFAFEDAELYALRRLPPITGASGEGTLTGTVFSARVTDAQMAVPAEGAGAISLRNALIQVPDLRVKPRMLEVSFDGSGATGDILAFFASPAMRDPNAPPPEGKPFLSPQDATGTTEVATTLSIPLRVTTRPKDIRFTAVGAARNFETTAIIPGRELIAEEMRINVNTDTLSVSGPVTLDGEALNATYERVIGAAAENKGDARIIAEGGLTEALVAGFGVNLGRGAISGTGAVRADVTLSPGAPPKLEVKGDLKGVRLSMPGLGVSKSRAAAGSVELAGTLGQGGRLSTLKVNAPGLTLDGQARFGDNGQGVSSLQFDRAKLGSWLDASLRLTPRRGGPAIDLSGGTFDLRNLPQGSGGGSGGSSLGPVKVVLDKVIVTQGITLTGVRGNLNPDGSGTLTGSVNGAANVSVTLSPSTHGIALRVRSNDAGAVLRAAGLMRQVRGGSLDMRLTPQPGKGVFEGRVRVRDTALRNTPVLAEIIAGISVIGAVEQMAGSGITFDEVRMDFQLSPDRLVIKSSNAVGSSLGLSLDGVINLKSKVIDLQGVVSPVYFLNRAGSFLTRRGEGLVGISYRLTGSLDGPRVSMNPLSVLTPGFLREIFRTQPNAGQ